MRCVLFQPYYLVVGGAEKNVAKVAEALRNSGWDVCITLPGHGPVEKVASSRNLPVKILRPPEALDRFGGQFQKFSPLQIAWFCICFVIYNVSLAIWLRRTKTDLMIMNTARAPLIAGLAPKLAGIPSILYLRGYVPTTSRWERYVLRWLLWSPTHIVSVSRESFDTVLARIPKSLQGQALAKLTILYNWLEPISHPCNVNANTSTGQVTIGTLSNICRRKGIHYLIKMANELRKHGINYKLRIAGTVQERDYYQQQTAEVERLGLSHNVEFCGYVDSDQFLNTIDIFVLASEHEGMPMAILEALQHGVPVVAFAAEGVREALLDGAVGSVVPVGDWRSLTEEVARLAKDGALRQERSLAGIQRSAAFAREAQVRKLVSLMERMVRRGERQASKNEHDAATKEVN